MEGRYWAWLGVRLLVGVIIVGWAFSYLSPGGGSAEKEFQRALDATKQVRSVRVLATADPEATLHMETLWEISCAQDAYRFKQHVVASTPEHPSESTREEVHVGPVEYEHKQDDSWQPHQFPVGVRTPGTICEKFATGGDTNIMPDIYTMIRRGILDKGDQKTVNGVRCRDWKITIRGGTGLEHDTLCLGLDDHLPYEMTVDSQRLRTTYSDYNSSFQVEVPAAALQPASANYETNSIAQ